MIVALVCLVAQGTLAQAEVNDEAGLTEAIGAGSNVSIKLAGNIGLSTTLVIPGNKTVTINLNGFVLDRGLHRQTNEVNKMGTSTGHVIEVQKNATLTLTDGTISGNKSPDGGDTLDGRKLQGKPTQKGIYIRNDKKIVIK